LVESKQILGKSAIPIFLRRGRERHAMADGMWRWTSLLATFPRFGNFPRINMMKYVCRAEGRGIIEDKIPRVGRGFPVEMARLPWRVEEIPQEGLILIYSCIMVYRKFIKKKF
jgi:hypothetical protein